MTDLQFDNARCRPIRVEVGWPAARVHVGAVDQNRTGMLVAHISGTAFTFRP